MAERVGRYEDLLWLRERLIRQIDADETCVCERPKQSQLAPLAARLAEVVGQLEAIEKLRPRGSKVDEIADRRKARRTGAKGAGVARRGRGDVGAGSG